MEEFCLLDSCDPEQVLTASSSELVHEALTYVKGVGFV
jgi:hypothetical protein